MTDAVEVDDPVYVIILDVHQGHHSVVGFCKVGKDEFNAVRLYQVVDHMLKIRPGNGPFVKRISRVEDRYAFPELPVVMRFARIDHLVGLKRVTEDVHKGKEEGSADAARDLGQYPLVFLFIKEPFLKL